MPEGDQEVVDHGRVRDRRTPGETVQIDVEIPVREVLFDLMRPMHHHGCLADAGHPVDDDDPARRLAGFRFADRGVQCGKGGRAADEVGHVLGNLMRDQLPPPAGTIVLLRCSGELLVMVAQVLQRDIVGLVPQPPPHVEVVRRAFGRPGNLVQNRHAEFDQVDVQRMFGLEFVEPHESPVELPRCDQRRQQGDLCGQPFVLDDPGSPGSRGLALDVFERIAAPQADRLLGGLGGLLVFVLPYQVARLRDECPEPVVVDGGPVHVEPVATVSGRQEWSR
jgi:hypothetical protein